MNQYITDVVATKTDDELYTFIENREKYLPETVLASVNELQSRGVEFGQDELDVIEQDMRARAELALDEPGQSLFATNGWKYKLVDDDFAPRYFSQLVVFLFSVFAGAFFWFHFDGNQHRQKCQQRESYIGGLLRPSF